MSPSPRHSVCMLASEVAPLSKTGGLADVAGALSKALRAAGHDVRLFTPAYSSIDRAACGAQPVPALQKLPLAVGVQQFAFSVLQGTLPGGTPVYLIDCPALFARAALYTSDADEHVRFIAFTRAALMACVAMRWAPRVVHCNDWHTAFAPLFLRTVLKDEAVFATTSTLLTIHNIGYQGIFGADRGTWAWRLRTGRACMRPISPPATSAPCATASSTPMRSTPSAPPTRARSARASTAWGSRTACARAART